MITKISHVTEINEALTSKLEKCIDELFKYAEKSEYLNLISTDVYTFYLKFLDIKSNSGNNGNLHIYLLFYI